VEAFFLVKIAEEKTQRQTGGIGQGSIGSGIGSFL
jgi:hypothetical protein